MAFFLLSACSFSRLASNLTATILKAGTPAFEEESDIDLAEQASLTMLKTVEAFERHNPNNKTYLLLLAKSYGTYAYGFLENRMLQFQGKDEPKYNAVQDRAKLFYSRGKEYGLRLIAREDKGFAAALNKGLPALRKELLKFKGKNIDAIFWTAFSWGNYINLTKDNVRSVSDLAVVEALMARVLEVSPNFYYGGPHLFYGVYYASRPPMLGGNSEEARKHFELAMRATDGKFLLSQVLAAQFLAVQIQDKKLFLDLLRKTEESSLEILPEQRLANALAKERGRYLKERDKEFFQ